MDDLTWAALTVALTVVGALYTWFAFKRRGAAAGLRGAAYTLLPAAAYLTGALGTLTEIAYSISDWAFGLVFRPTVWIGVGLAGVSALLFVISGLLRSRAIARGRQAKRPKEEAAPPSGAAQAAEAPADRSELGAADKRSEPPLDDDLADIESILKSRGIT